MWGDLPSEILFPIVRMDETGKPLNGERQYGCIFLRASCRLPRYWRISLYDIDGFLPATPSSATASVTWPRIGDQFRRVTDHLHPARLSRQRQEYNWLPAPKEGFFLMMRMYQPEEKMYRGAYVLPPLQEVK